MMKSTVFVIIISLLVSQQGFSQFNDSVFHHLRFSSQGIFNRTNDNKTFTLTNALGFTIRKKKVSFNSANNWIYGRQNSRLTNNDFSSVFNVDHLKDVQKLYYWGLTSFASSYSLKINYQFQAGGGIGYNFINTKQFEIVASDGLLFESSDLGKDSTRIIYQTLRNSLRIKHRFQTGIVSWEGTHFWQPSLSDLKDYIIRSNTTISLRLKRWLSISGGLTYNNISRTKRENLLMNFGLTIDSYF